MTWYRFEVRDRKSGNIVANYHGEDVAEFKTTYESGNPSLEVTVVDISEEKAAADLDEVRCAEEPTPREWCRAMFDEREGRPDALAALDDRMTALDKKYPRK